MKKKRLKKTLIASAIFTVFCLVSIIIQNYFLPVWVDGHEQTSETNAVHEQENIQENTSIQEEVTFIVEGEVE
ncbi:hypothetical protein AwErysi_05840 [Erysipelotrichaceae bacterium]|nr:hypothetical protein AwErysi_05840 [Erysipelotrichaceae bacterium]